MERLTSQRALRNSVIITMLVVLIGMGVTLANSERGPKEVTWERIQREKIIRVGVDSSIPPFGIFTDEEPIGFDPDLAKELSKHFDAVPHFRLLTYDGLYNALLYGEVDIVIAALRPDPLRTDLIRYSNPYFDAGQVLVSPTGIETLDDLNSGILAVEFASAGENYARQFEEISVEPFLTADEALTAVEAGEAEAALVDRVSASLYLASNEDSTLQIASESLVPDPYVIAMRRQDWRLHRALNDAIEAMQADGSLDALIRMWLLEWQGSS